MLEAESRATGGVDLDHAGNAERIRIGAGRLLRKLKEGGYKVVQIKAKTTLQSLPEYDEALSKELKVPSVAATRPVTSVVQTVSK